MQLFSISMMYETSIRLITNARIPSSGGTAVPSDPQCRPDVQALFTGRRDFIRYRLGGCGLDTHGRFESSSIQSSFLPRFSYMSLSLARQETYCASSYSGNCDDGNFLSSSDAACILFFDDTSSFRWMVGLRTTAALLQSFLRANNWVGSEWTC